MSTVDELGHKLPVFIESWNKIEVILNGTIFRGKPFTSNQAVGTDK